RATFEAKTGLKLSELKGLRILDAGCGGGRYCKVAGEAGAEVVGVDHTPAVEKAKSLCSHLPNVTFAQADLKHLPFEPGQFDVAFSIGVMHHDVDTRAVFEAVAKMVRPGGKLAVWLYRRNQGWQEAINDFLRHRTTRMDPDKLEKWCRCGALLGGIPVVNRTLNKIVSFSAHPSYENRICDTFDWYAPQYQHHHTVAELLDWFDRAGFDELIELPPEKGGLVYRWMYHANLLVGSGLGALIGVAAPGYYHAVFESGQSPDFNPFQVGVGLGLTQGAGLGIALAVGLLFVSFYRETREPDEPPMDDDPDDPPTRTLVSNAVALVVWIVVTAFVVVVASGVAFVIGGIVAQQQLYQSWGDRKLETAEEVLSSTPQFENVEVHLSSAAQIFLDGTVANEAIRDELHRQLQLAFGTAEADLLIEHVHLSPEE
ncbi:Ubiquinone biosynthesis O-methyltransferase (2-polyprenyl-6-hydroxyphenol methylase) (3-demethylubiquinone 3-O-methyltransferase), partial [Durusdinium trenchii]